MSFQRNCFISTLPTPINFISSDKVRVWVSTSTGKLYRRSEYRNKTVASETQLRLPEQYGAY